MKDITDETVKNFLRGKSVNTYRSYAAAWRAFEAYISPKPPREATIPEAVGFVGALSQSSLTKPTVRNRVDALRSIFQFLEDCDEIVKNPFRAAKRVLSERAKAQTRPTKILTPEQIERVLSLPDKSKDGIRDRAVLAIGFGCGLRRSEIHRIRISDVRLSEGIPYIFLPTSKGGRADEQPIPSWALGWIMQLIDQRLAEGAKENDALFVVYYIDGTPRGHCVVNTIYRIFKRYFGAIGVTAAPHAARASAATMLKDQGYEDRDVARFLRHSTTTMVAVYDKRKRSLENHPGLNLHYPTVIVTKKPIT